MDKRKKASRYARLFEQIRTLVEKSSNNPYSTMATICAVLHYKMDHYFWTGFYLLQEDRLQVAAYQGPLACIDLAKDTGVCWAGINSGKTVVVQDVETFPGHIACDSRSRSEIVVPVRNKASEIIGVLDVDSESFGAFDEVDKEWLEKIVTLIG
jgi:L-methionine (R)-S-oxide reductase